MPDIQARVKISSLEPLLISTPSGWKAVTTRKDEVNEKEKEEEGGGGIILFTSGSSGEGDRVLLTSSNLISNLNQIDKVVQSSMIHRTDTSFSILPWSHCYGLVCELLFLIQRGASIHIPSSRANLSKDLVKSRPTILFTVPILLERILQSLKFTRHPYYHYARPVITPILREMILGGRLRAVSVGGARSSTESLEMFQHVLGVQCFQGYGMTECSPMISLQTDVNHKIGSVGKPLPGIDVHIDPSTSEILVAGENVCKTLPSSRYTQINNKLFLKTGDSGSLDTDGFLFISDRMSEHFKLVNGLFVHPRRIEMIYDAFRPHYISQWVILPYSNHRHVIMVGMMNSSLSSSSHALESSELEKIGKNGGLFPHEIPRSIYYMSKEESEPFLTEKQTPRRGLLTRYMSIHYK
jgi:long-chain acyl-CoA synthetase